MGLSGYQQEDPGSRVPAPWQAAGPGVPGAGPPVGVDRERECLPAGQHWVVAQTDDEDEQRRFIMSSIIWHYMALMVYIPNNPSVHQLDNHRESSMT